ncbi:MAG: molybdopterin-dependent oxidoreductase [Thermoleophilia bacterium]
MSPEESSKTEAVRGEWKKVMCRLCGIKVWCTAQMYVEDEVILKVEGDPENPMNEGRLCARGQSAIMNVYNPYRVTAPMKRTNPKKGLDEDPGWVEISWDEALDTVAAKMSAARATDPRRFAHMFGFGGYGWIVTDGAFMPAFGSQNELRSHGHLCPVHFGAGMVQGSFLDKQDVEYCEYFLAVGGSLGPNIGSTHSMRATATALERGMKLVVVDPRCSPEATLADEWVPIRPGTDLAFTLAMLHVMLHEDEVWDVEFLKRRTNAVYLIAEDGHYLAEPGTGKPLVWDETNGGAKPFDDPTVGEYALHGTYETAGATGTTAFDLIRAHMLEYTPEWAEEVTAVPAATIRRLAREFVDHARIGETITLDGFEFPFRPVAIKSERGALSNKAGAYQHLAAKMVAGLVGALDVPGSYLASDAGPSLSPGPDGVVAPKAEAAGCDWSFPPSIDLKEFYPHRHTSPFLAWKAILHPETYGIDYEIDALVTYAANPIMGSVNPDEAIEAFKRIPFIATIPLVYDEMSQFADILLPESVIVERHALIEFGHHVVQAADEAMLRVKGVLVQKPVIPPVYNTRQADDIYIELAERVGFLYGPNGLNDRLNAELALAGEHALDLHTKYTTPEIMDRILRCRYGDDHSLDWFDDHAVYPKMLSKKEAYNFYYHPWGETRYPLYFERLLASGERLKKHLAEVGLEVVPGQDPEDFWLHYQPLPRWCPRPDDGAATEFDLLAINWSTPQWRMSAGDQVGNVWVQEYVEANDPYEYRILINSATALEKGFADGEDVIVEAWHGGRTRGRLKLTELIFPEALGFPSNHGFKSRQRNPITHKGPHYNELLTGDEGTIDPISAGIDRAPRVKIYRAADSTLATAAVAAPGTNNGSAGARAAQPGGAR